MSIATDTIRVLHVDDDADFAEFTQVFLEGKDDRFEVMSTERAELGLQRLEEDDFDCIVSDYVLPNRDGIDFLRAVREVDAEIPFILYTDEGSEELASQAISSGVTDYLKKPPGKEQSVLAERISRVVDRYRVQQESSGQGVDSGPAERNDILESVRGRAASPEETIRRLLSYTSEHLDRPYVFLTRRVVEGNDTAIITEMHGSPPSLELGMRVPLDPGDQPHASASQPKLDPDHQLTVPVIVNDTRYGTLWVVDEEASIFREAERSIAESIGQWIGLELELREARAEATGSATRLETVASMVSHDLRNPLTVATGRLELMRREYDSEHTESIGRALTRLERLIESAVRLAREGELVSHAEPINIASIVEQCWQELRTESASLEVGSMGLIRADEDALEQLLGHLLKNAIEHGGDQLTVRVDDCPDGFIVEDDGVGIAEELRSNIFEAGSSTIQGKTGFGLFLTRQLCEDHGWKIRVTDAKEGGARFEISGVTFVSSGSDES